MTTMDSRIDSQANRGEMASSMSKPTDARSSTMGVTNPDGKAMPNKNQKGEGLGSIFECMSCQSPILF